MEEKCISLQGVLKVKDDEVIVCLAGTELLSACDVNHQELTRLNKKILFMLGRREGRGASCCLDCVVKGMREGEIADLYTRIEKNEVMLF